MTDKTGPYAACNLSQNEPPYRYGISGPGDGLGFYTWYGHPENTFDTHQEAAKAARLMNLAFREGQKNRSREISKIISDF